MSASATQRASSPSPSASAAGSVTTPNATGAQKDGRSLYAGIATSALRGLALYFSRPVRLFRPVKASGWTSLRYAAERDGTTLSPRYISLLVKQHGITVLPRHFLPPLIINSCLGALLFTSYTAIDHQLSSTLPNCSTTTTAAIAGGFAGAIQAVAGAPAENVRIIMERGFFNPEKSVSGWREAWKEVFRGNSFDPKADSSISSSRRPSLHELRELRGWVHEVRGMAGRGWDGWGWGCAKDVCGFTIFFAVFDLSRKTALATSNIVDRFSSSGWTPSTLSYSLEQLSDIEHAKAPASKTSTSARISQGAVLVSGGVVAGVGYELAARPFDIIRREAHIQAPHQHHQHTLTELAHVVRQVLLEQGGIRALFRPPGRVPVSQNDPDAMKAKAKIKTGDWRTRRLFPLLRTLARVGPWGAGFLVWEAVGPGIQ